MNEIYRPTQGDIITTPVDLTGVKNVTNTAPRASRGDLSHDMMGGPSLRDRALAVTLALSTLGGAKVILDSQTAKGQSPSPAPSIGASFEPSTSPVATDPITGLPCVPGVKPTAEPSQSIIPDRTLPPDIGMAPGGEIELFAFANTNGDTVKVTVGAQSEPSAVPTAAPEASPTATDPETAANCPPSEFKAELKGNLPEEPVTYDTFKQHIDDFYNSHPEALKYKDQFDNKLSAKGRNKLIKNCQKGMKGTGVDPEAMRAGSCSTLVLWFYSFAEKYQSPEMLTLAQEVYWYAISDIKVSDPKAEVDKYLKPYNVHIVTEEIAAK